MPIEAQRMEVRRVMETLLEASVRPTLLQNGSERQRSPPRAARLDTPPGRE